MAFAAFVIVLLFSTSITLGSRGMNQQCPDSQQLEHQVMMDIPDFTLEAGSNVTQNIHLTWINTVPADLDNLLFTPHIMWFREGHQTLPALPASCHTTTSTEIPVTVSIPKGAANGKYTENLTVSFQEGVEEKMPVLVTVGSQTNMQPEPTIVTIGAIGVVIGIIAVVVIIKRTLKKPNSN